MTATISGTNGGIGLIGSGTAQNTTSGTAITLTGIPAGAKRITVMINGVSTNGTSPPVIRLGTSGGVQTSGYNSATGSVAGSGVGAATYTDGFSLVSSGHQATYVFYGTYVFVNISGNTWTASGDMGLPGVAICFMGGSVTLSGTLDRVQLTTSGGTNTFDAGSINILYE